MEENGHHHARTDSVPPKDLASFADDYRKLAIDCLKVLRIEMQLETIFHLQVCDIFAPPPKVRKKSQKKKRDKVEKVMHFYLPSQRNCSSYKIILAAKNVNWYRK